MNSPRGTVLMKNYATDCGETHRQAQLHLPASILLKNLPNTHRDAITRYPNCSPNDENLLDTLMGNRFSATIVKNPSQIMHTTVYDTLLRCTEQGVQNHTPNHHGSQSNIMLNV